MMDATFQSVLRLWEQGLTVKQIAERLDKSEKAVIARIPYDKGIYNAEFPSINALRIRKCRAQKE